MQSISPSGETVPTFTTQKLISLATYHVFLPDLAPIFNQSRSMEQKSRLMMALRHDIKQLMVMEIV